MAMLHGMGLPGFMAPLGGAYLQPAGERGRRAVDPPVRLVRRRCAARVVRAVALTAPRAGSPNASLPFPLYLTPRHSGFGGERTASLPLLPQTLRKRLRRTS